MIPNGIQLYLYISALSICHQKGFLQQQMEVGAETHSQTVGRESVKTADLFWVHALRDLGTWQKRGRKNCSSQRGQRSPGEHGLLSQLNSTHIASQRLKQQAQGLHGSVPCPLCM